MLEESAQPLYGRGVEDDAMTVAELEALVRVHLDLLDTRTKAPPLRRALDPVVSTARR